MSGTDAIADRTWRTLAIGGPAPDFTLRDQHGQDVTLSSYRGSKAVLLVFYPFAFTGVCTGELAGIRDRLGDFRPTTPTLLAISCDPMYTQRASPTATGSSSRCSPTSGRTARSPRPTASSTRRRAAPERSSFVVDKEGVVRWAVHNDMRRGAATSTSTPLLHPIA